ncbi:MAG: FecR domain-containing protein [Bacteriovoracaceae bacterium]|nr:FecR domain-containing protein [Bacteriovoracaceae bacterium]
MKSLIITFLFSISSLAELAVIKQIRGEVYLGDVSLKPGARIKQNGMLRSGKNSFARISIPHMNNTLILGPNSTLKLVLDSPTPKDRLNLRDGIARWISSENKGNSSKAAMSSLSASMGVRGTDFLVIANKLLGETEIIMFEGQVLFQSNSDNTDKALLTKNQWGGIGGRFGSSIGKVLDLPTSVVKAFKTKLSP